VPNGASFGAVAVDFTADAITPTNTGQFVAAIDIAAFGNVDAFTATATRVFPEVRPGCPAMTPGACRAIPAWRHMPGVWRTASPSVPRCGQKQTASRKTLPLRLFGHDYLPTPAKKTP